MKRSDLVTVAQVKGLHDALVKQLELGIGVPQLDPEQILALCRCYQSQVIALRKVCAASNDAETTVHGKAVGEARQLLSRIGVAVATH